MSARAKKPRLGRIAVTIDQATKRRIDLALMITGQSREAFIRDALSEWFSRHGSVEHLIVERIRERKAAVGGGK